MRQERMKERKKEAIPVRNRIERNGVCLSVLWSADQVQTGKQAGLRWNKGYVRVAICFVVNQVYL